MSVKRFQYFVIFLVLGMGQMSPAFAYTLDQMAAAMNVLRVEMDGHSVCGIDSQTLNRLPQLLQAKIDQLKEGDLKYLNNCEARCRCGFYETWLKARQPTHPKISELGKRALSLNSKSALQCAEKNRWFCKSALLQQLKTSADF
jgi:hypothetical protein